MEGGILIVSLLGRSFSEIDFGDEQYDEYIIICLANAPVERVAIPLRYIKEFSFIHNGRRVHGDGLGYRKLQKTETNFTRANDAKLYIAMLDIIDSEYDGVLYHDYDDDVFVNISSEIFEDTIFKNYNKIERLHKVITRGSGSRVSALDVPDYDKFIKAGSHYNPKREYTPFKNDGVSLTILETGPHNGSWYLHFESPK